MGRIGTEMLKMKQIQSKFQISSRGKTPENFEQKLNEFMHGGEIHQGNPSLLIWGVSL